jgi:predicted MFS family arabinose efflux permease
MPDVQQQWSRRVAVLAVASAIAVSVIYLPQSLLTDLARDLGVDAATASAAATTVQVGYAAGILLLVPLADRIDPRRQVTVQSLVLAAVLIVSALLPGVAAVALGFLVVGLVATSAQVIIPAASRLAPPGRARSTTGTLVGALTIGIFGGRIVASLLVGLVGWRWVDVIFAGLVLAVLPLARRALAPQHEPDAPAADAPPAGARPADARRGGYPRLLLSTVALLRTSPPLLQSALLQFFVFATFISIWTVMVLHLTGPAFGWTVLQAGLFGLVGLAAGILTPVLARMLDGVPPLRLVGILLGVLLLACAAMVVDSDLLIPFGITVFVSTAAGQTIQSIGQSRALTANPTRTAQANTMFMFTVFLGGSTGALLGTIAYTDGGMPRVAAQATVFVLLAAAVWVVSAIAERRRDTSPLPLSERTT